MPSLADSSVVYLVPHYSSIGEGSSLRSVAVANILAEHCSKLTVITPDIAERVLTKKKEKRTRDGKIFIDYMKGNEGYRNSFLSRLRHELTMAWNCRQLLKQINPDIIIASYPPAFTPVPSVVFRWFNRKTKVILEVRDLMAGALKATGYTRNKFLLFMASLYENWLLRTSNAVAIVSPGMKDHVLKVKANQTVLNAYNGIEDTLLDFAKLKKAGAALPAKFLKQSGLSKEGKFVVYAGALTQSYDLPTLIEGFSKANMEGVKFLILGNGDKRPAYEKMVEDRKLQNVVFCDFVDRETALKVIAAAEVAMHAFNSNPHWNYVLGNKVFDYIAVGTPVLFAGAGTTADLVEDSGSGKVCPPEDADKLAEILTALVESSPQYKKKPFGRDYIMKHWKRSQQTEAFVKNLEQFASG